MNVFGHCIKSAFKLHFIGHKSSVYALGLITAVVEHHKLIAELIKPKLHHFIYHGLCKVLIVVAAESIPAVPSHGGQVIFLFIK